MSLSVDNPKVSVLLPAYNAEKFLVAAIESLLSQSFHDLEILLIDDYSNDGTPKIASSFDDQRVRHYRNSKNIGVACSVNRAIELSRSQYLARMDADDLCHPDRLRKQVQFLEINRDIDVLGTFARTFGDSYPETLTQPITHESIRARLLFSSPMIHPTLMFRKRRLFEVGLRYDEQLAHGEEYDLFDRSMRAGLRYHNLPEVLLDYRKHPEQISTRQSQPQLVEAERIRAKIIANAGIELRPDELAILQLSLSPVQRIESFEDFLSLREVYRQIKTKGRHIPRLEEELAFQWFRACYRHTHLGPKILAIHLGSKMNRGYRPPPVKYLKFNYRALSRSV